MIPKDKLSVSTLVQKAIPPGMFIDSVTTIGEIISEVQKAIEKREKSGKTQNVPVRVLVAEIAKGFGILSIRQDCHGLCRRRSPYSKRLSEV